MAGKFAGGLHCSRQEASQREAIPNVQLVRHDAMADGPGKENARGERRAGVHGENEDRSIDQKRSQDAGEENDLVESILKPDSLALAQALNKLAKGPSLHDPACFPDRVLSPETLELYFRTRSQARREAARLLFRQLNSRAQSQLSSSTLRQIPPSSHFPLPISFNRSCVLALTEGKTFLEAALLPFPARRFCHCRVATPR